MILLAFSWSSFFANVGQFILSFSILVVLHELGHTCGLVHCTDRTCAMALATNVAQLDAKQPRYCESCRALMENNPCNTIGKY